MVLEDMKQMKLKVKIAEELEQENFEQMSVRQRMKWMKRLGGM